MDLAGYANLQRHTERVQDSNASDIHFEYQNWQHAGRSSNEWESGREEPYLTDVLFNSSNLNVPEVMKYASQMRDLQELAGSR